MERLWGAVSGVFWKTVPTTTPAAEWIEDLGASSLFITVFGALAGTFAGAWAAQRLARVGKRRDELVAEIRAINAANVMSHSIFESALVAKVEYIQPASEKYEAQRLRYLEALASPPVGGEILINFNLLRFPELAIPVGQIQSLILQQGSTPALRAFVALAEYSGLLQEATALRNTYLDKFEKKELPPGFSYPDVYFGVLAKEGHHQQYSSVMSAIPKYCDDVIFYSRRLCEYLSQYAENLKKELKRKSTESIGVVQFDFEFVDKEGLMPASDSYKAWEESYVEIRRPTLLSRWCIWRK